jgi:DNA replication and repair protein RecF
MPLIRFECEGVRNLEATTLEPDPRLNIVVGPNASGKTSLLEAIYVLGSGKSFRTAKLDKAIQHEATEFLVRGIIEENGARTRLGYRRSGGGREIRIDGGEVQLSAELAHHLPVQAVTPDTHFAFLHNSAARRGAVDWPLFHVEPEFFPVWSEYRRVLRQRNVALKQARQPGEFLVWEQALARAGERIQRFRQEMLQDLSRRTMALAHDLLGVDDLELRLRSGWRQEQSLAEALESDRQRDRELGHTHSGPHRADLEIDIRQRDARQEASQGQWKTLVLILRLAQLALFAERTGRGSVFLLDDLPAELDRARRQAVVEQLTQLPLQVFTTATGMNEFGFEMPGERRVFHVEQGRVTPDSSG